MRRTSAFDIRFTMAWVYVIQSSVPPHLIKIGRSVRNPRNRLSALQVGSPVELYPVLYLRGCTMLEALLHQTFKRYHQRGEWFLPKGDLARFIKRCRDEGVKNVGPEIARDWIAPYAEAEDHERICELVSCFEIQARSDAWKYPWLTKAGVEKSASDMVRSHEAGVATG